MRALPGQIKGLLSPTKVKMRPKQLRAWVRTYHPEICLDGVIPEKLKAQLTTLHETASKKSSQQLMEPGQVAGAQPFSPHPCIMRTALTLGRGA